MCCNKKAEAERLDFTGKSYSKASNCAGSLQVDDGLNVMPYLPEHADAVSRMNNDLDLLKKDIRKLSFDIKRLIRDKRNSLSSSVKRNSDDGVSIMSGNIVRLTADKARLSRTLTKLSNDTRRLSRVNDRDINLMREISKKRTTPYHRDQNSSVSGKVELKSTSNVNKEDQKNIITVARDHVEDVVSVGCNSINSKQTSNVKKEQHKNIITIERDSAEGIVTTSCSSTNRKQRYIHMLYTGADSKEHQKRGKTVGTDRSEDIFPSNTTDSTNRKQRCTHMLYTGADSRLEIDNCEPTTCPFNQTLKFEDVVEDDSNNEKQNSKIKQTIDSNRESITGNSNTEAKLNTNEPLKLAHSKKQDSVEYFSNRWSSGSLVMDHMNMLSKLLSVEKESSIVREVQQEFILDKVSEVINDPVGSNTESESSYSSLNCEEPSCSKQQNIKTKQSADINQESESKDSMTASLNPNELLKFDESKQLELSQEKIREVISDPAVLSKPYSSLNCQQPSCSQQQCIKTEQNSDSGIKSESETSTTANPSSNELLKVAESNKLGLNQDKIREVANRLIRAKWVIYNAL